MDAFAGDSWHSSAMVARWALVRRCTQATMASKQAATSVWRRRKRCGAGWDSEAAYWPPRI